MTYKNYTTKAAARRAITKAGLQNVPHAIMLISRTWEPVFSPELVEDAEYIRDEKGFNAITPAANDRGQQ